MFIHNEAHLITMSTIYSQGDWREKGSRLRKFWPAVSRIIIFMELYAGLCVYGALVPGLNDRPASWITGRWHQYLILNLPRDR